ncbi:MAG: cell division protein SepF [Bifidobacteriaceae bacterium]|jgi:cell division inhibitor SepF|nr:cell division protein SepF [Bifidobacteriaceae bacterium]
MLGLTTSADADDYYDEGVGETMAEVTPIHGAAGYAPEPEPLQRIATARPRFFGDARTVGEPYRSGIPVIMNLTNASDEDVRRLVDFASGMVLALDGKLERITPRVFLLSPATVQVQAQTSERANRYDGE